MNAAMETGAKTIGRFFSAHEMPRSNQERFNVKIRLRTGPRVEYIWVEEIERENDGSVTGLLQNQPAISRTHRLGDRVSFSIGDIVDWAYIEDGYLIGGFTLRVMFEQYPQKQRTELQEKLGYRIDPSKGI